MNESGEPRPIHRTAEKRSCNFYVSDKKKRCKIIVDQGNKFCGQHLDAQKQKSKKKNESGEPESEKRSCNFYLSHKKRFCKMLVAQGNEFCGQHLVGQKDKSGKQFKRVPCPLDPKHSCYEHRMDAHLMNCNAKEDTTCPFRTTSCNLGPKVEEPERLRIANLTNQELLQLVDKINKAYSQYIGNSIIEEIYDHPALKKALEKPEYGPGVIRHLRQNASLLGHIQENGGFDDEVDKVCYLEFGAGKGQLTCWLVEAIENAANKIFVLVDRGAQRHKHDAKLRCNPDLDMKRIRIDIEHLDLKKVKDVMSADKVFGIGKHLCGGATDLSLRCLSENSGTNITCIIIALCCHHRCTWQSYSGRDFIQKAGFKPEEFSLMSGLTSWAVCDAKEEENKTNSNDNDHEQLTDNDLTEEKNENRYKQLGLTVEEREEIGVKTKQIINYGRIEFLKSKGFQSKLIYYVTKDLTLENVALIAYKDKNHPEEP